MTLQEIAKALEYAVNSVTAKKQAADDAKKAAEAAVAAYGESLAKVKELHAEYMSTMSSVLSGFGQIHK